MRTIRRRSLAALAISTAALALAGCGMQSKTEPLLDTAGAFRTALASGDGAAACDLLNDATRVEVGDDCAARITALGIPVADDGEATADVEGHAAIVEFSNDTLFFTKAPEGWRVIAAGCVPRTEAPYQCTVEGP